MAMKLRGKSIIALVASDEMDLDGTDASREREKEKELSYVVKGRDLSSFPLYRSLPSISLPSICQGFMRRC